MIRKRIEKLEAVASDTGDYHLEVRLSWEPPGVYLLNGELVSWGQVKNLGTENIELRWSNE